VRLPALCPAPRGERHRGPLTLAGRVVVVNTAVMFVASLVLAFGPVTVSYPIRLHELLVLGIGASVTIATNLLLVRRAFAPLERLTAVMRRIDPLAPGVRIDVPGAAWEVAQLTEAFNAMLDRLETERRESARRALRARESERRRLARELHDELGQALTGVLLQIDDATRTMDPSALEAARTSTRESLEDVRRIARDLRPGTLVDLGLSSALRALATRFTSQSGVPVERDIAADVPQLSEDAELVVYRVAQEALTNVARHAGATRVHLALRPAAGGVELVVEDDGGGMPAYVGPQAGGITGMRERALLVGGRLRVLRGEQRGTRVHLEVPAR
jgi:two-component system, NarL family, sensor histidine kinase UhpB